MTDRSKQGTGDEFGSFGLGEYTVRIEDDGCNDSDVRCTVVDADGEQVHRGLSGLFGRLRHHAGDDGLADLLSGDVEASTGDDVGGTTTVYDPPSFKCDGECNRTCPWSWNETPDDPDRDVCKECYDG